MDEGTCLENRHTLSAYHGFESHPLRQSMLSQPLSANRCSASMSSINGIASEQSDVVPSVRIRRTGIPCESTARCSLVFSHLLYGPSPDFLPPRPTHEDEP